MMVYTDAIDSAMQPDRGDDSWRAFSDSMHESLSRLEEIVNDIADMRGVCRDEWCEMNECMLGEATVSAFAISEPHFAPEEDSKKLKELKKRIHDLHRNLKPSQ
ncbi:MAG: hypothetical protein WAW37_11815 [Syntrophobacteraceae bacterium]